MFAPSPCLRRVGSVRRLSQASPVTQFALSGLVATLAIGLLAVAAMRHVGRQQAISDAKRVTRLAGEGIVAPLLTPEALRGDPAALARLDRVVRDRVLHDGVVRVKIWAPDGRVIYSDEPRLMGVRYPLSPGDVEALRRGTVEAEVSNLGEPENRFERAGAHRLLEVYLPIRATDGRPALFEVYEKESAIAAGGRRLWLAFAPALLGGLVLLLLVSLPLAASMARRLREGQRQREALLAEALDASQRERRRIAADLHDGVVQDLVGVSYTLQADAQRVNGEPVPGEVLVHAANQTRDSVRALRTLLVDIYPPSLHRSGLVAALDDVARTATARGLATVLDAPEGLELSERSEELLFRCGQEALRNALKHAGARIAVVAIHEQGDRVVLEVTDDGRGFVPGAATPADAHFGLAMLGDLMSDAGGRLDVTSRPGAGTCVRAEVPR
jgi:signal transduction histidine kinase